ncbi:uncharacterized protein L201_006755 [Kwoniella dendrophila CBS 6074]|uniref:Uncharacterized protein n=1 Tax=Kwoniella dendrophila CBS 6074 TaxID=1295534 RepID=A0AAX4K3R2_9TREE
MLIFKAESGFHQDFINAWLNDVYSLEVWSNLTDHVNEEIKRKVVDLQHDSHSTPQVISRQLSSTSLENSSGPPFSISDHQFSDTASEGLETEISAERSEDVEISEHLSPDVLIEDNQFLSTPTDLQNTTKQSMDFEDNAVPAKIVIKGSTQEHIPQQWANNLLEDEGESADLELEPDALVDDAQVEEISKILSFSEINQSRVREKHEPVDIDQSKAVSGDGDK